MPCACGSGKETVLVYACSGAANTGLLADRVARKLAADGEASMTCLAAIGADLSGFIESARAADRNLVIDGCPVGCGKRAFGARNLPFTHVLMTAFGVEKGKTPITDGLVDSIAEKVALGQYHG